MVPPLTSRPVLWVVRPTGLGDLLMSVPALRAVRRTFPDHELLTTCPASLVPLAGRVGVVDRFVIEVGPGRPAVDPADHRRVGVDVLDALFAEPARPDVVVVLKMPEADLDRRIRRREPRLHIAFAVPDPRDGGGPAGGGPAGGGSGGGSDDGGPDAGSDGGGPDAGSGRAAGVVDRVGERPRYEEHLHVLARWEGLLEPYGIEPDRAELTLDVDVGGAPVPPDVGDTVVHLGSGSPTRRWPVERWAAVAAALHREGRRVVFTGSSGEGSLVAAAVRRAGLPAGADRSGTDVLELARTVARAGLVLGVDSGVAHLATVLRRRAVTLFGPTPPAVWGPPPGDDRHRVLWTGRRGDAYGSAVDPGLLEITVDDVLSAVAAPWPAPPAGPAPPGL